MVVWAVVDSLLMTLTMVGFGRLFLRRPPRQINMWYGYRTAMSMRSRETWDFAHRFAGRVWIRSGLVNAVVSALFILVFWRLPSCEYLFLVLVFLQMVILFAVIPITERALRRRFDDGGRPKN